MELDSFILEKYSNYNIEHKTTVIELCNDKSGRDYLGNLLYAIERIEERKEISEVNNVYIAYHDESAVGYISITTKDNIYEISYGIRPKYRKEYLGSLLLQEFSKKILELYPEIQVLTLMINNSNIGSSKVADLAGYVRENSVRHTKRRM